LGKLVNIIVNGKTVAVSEEDAERLSGAHTARRETDQEGYSRTREAANADRASGFGQGAKAFVEGAADAVTGGLYGKVAGMVSPDYGEDLANRGEHRPGLRAAGEVASFLVPGGLPNLAAHAGEAVTARVAAGAVNPLTRGATAGANAAGRAVEGAIVGLGGHVASTNVTGDPLSIESTLLSVGTGAVLNVGIGAVADRVRSIGTRAEGATSEAAAQRADVDLLKEGRDVFAKPRDSWEGFKESIKSVSADDAKAVTTERKASEQWSKWIGSNAKVEGAIRKAEKARNELQSRISQTTYGRAGTGPEEALGEAAATRSRHADKATR